MKTRGFSGWFFPHDSGRWLSLLRIGLGLEIVIYSWSLRQDWHFLFTGNGRGLIGRDLIEAILDSRSIWAPRLGWLVTIGGRAGLSETSVLSLAWAALFGAGCCLVLGFLCRPAAIAAWFIHVCAAKSGEVFSYGMDNFTTIGLFYLMIGQLPDRWALDWRLRRFCTRNSRRDGFQRRVLQIHLCIIYFSGGVAKSLGPGWWNGTSIWRAMTCPPFNVVSPGLLLSLRFLLPLAGISVCILETAYPFFIWPQRTRAFWLASILAMHLLIGLTMGLYLFSFVMIVLNVAGFGPGCFQDIGQRRHNVSDS